MDLLRAEIGKREPFTSLEHEAALNLIRTTSVLSEQAAVLLTHWALSAAQYNVLRILRGTGPSGLPCGQIGHQMVSREPDMTRLLDRLARRGLIERTRDQNDRRVVRTTLTCAAAKILAEIDEPILDLHRRQLHHLGEERLKQFIELLELARCGAIESAGGPPCSSSVSRAAQTPEGETS